MGRWWSGAVAGALLAAVTAGCSTAASPAPGGVISMTFAPVASSPASALATTAAIIRHRAGVLGLGNATIRAERGNVVITAPVGERAQLVAITAPGVLEFRQVLVTAPNTALPAPVPPPSPGTSPAATLAPQPGLSTWQEASGDAALVAPGNKALFDRLNCASKNWQQQIGYTPQIWDNASAEIVSCGTSGGVLYKFALAPAHVLGSQIKSASASLQPGSTFWEVTLNFNGAGTTALGNLTTQMYSHYGKSNSPLDDLAVVLDGQVISFPQINGRITGGNAQIPGSFTRSQARQLAADLQTGALPVSLHLTVTTSTSA